MIRILSTDGLAAQIRTIISEASKIVVLVSPFLDEKSNIYDYLHNLREKAYKVPVFIITRTPAQANVKNQTNAIKKLCEIQDCFVHYCPNLHTKCYFNECDLVITSLNMLSTSEERNFELGVHINKYDYDGKPFRDAMLKVNEICKAAIPTMNQVDNKGEFSLERMPAFCINSGEVIAYQGRPEEGNTTKKYIHSKVYKNLKLAEREEDHPQHYCHLCGRCYEKEMEKDADKKQKEKVFSAPPTLKAPFCKQCEEFLDANDLENFKINNSNA